MCFVSRAVLWKVSRNRKFPLFNFRIWPLNPATTTKDSSLWLWRSGAGHFHLECPLSSQSACKILPSIMFFMNSFMSEAWRLSQIYVIEIFRSKNYLVVTLAYQTMKSMERREGSHMWKTTLPFQNETIDPQCLRESNKSHGRLGIFKRTHN